ncbi:MAG: hypothetical protein ACLTSZ_14535 [Lachnospiraceae bacterium]
MHPNFIALVGSPVPMVIGTDLAGTAAWIEDETGIPAFGFSTTGLGAISFRGAFGREDDAEACYENRKKAGRKKAGMNTLGDLPLDFAGTDFMERFRIQVQELSIQIRASLFDRADMSQIDQIFSARWNTAVSYSGALLGAWLCRTQNMPCVTDFR